MAGTAGLDDDQPFHPEPVEQEPDGLDRLEDEVGERCEGETEKGRSRDHRQMSDKKQRNAVMWVFPQFAHQLLLRTRRRNHCYLKEAFAAPNANTGRTLSSSRHSSESSRKPH